LMKELGHGQGYRYAHNETDAYAAGEHYFPDEMPATRYYSPVERGLEVRIAEHLRRLRQSDEDAPQELNEKLNKTSPRDTAKASSIDNTTPEK